MTQTAKHEKLLSMASTKNGAPIGIYRNEAAELRVAGLIEMKESFSAVGARSLRWFRTQTEAA